MIAHTQWHVIAREALARGQRAVLVVVASGTGSTPRETGAVMVVTPERTGGTVGGGHLEHEALRVDARALAELDHHHRRFPVDCLDTEPVRLDPDAAVLREVQN